MDAARTLLLLRHGKSAWNTGASEDFFRPLKSRGRIASRTMGRWLLAENLVPDKTVSSTATRARETVSIATTAMMTPVEAVVWTKDIYEASVEMLLKVIAEHGEASRRLLLVGHNPGFESLAEHLGGHTLSPEERGKPFPSAGLAVIQLSPAWDALGRGCADSVRVIRPRELTPSSQGDC